MALAFKLYANQGKYADFYVNDTRVTLEKVYSPNRFKLKVHGEFMDSLHEITDARATEILPEVFVSAGDRVAPGNEEAKVVISAPRHIKVDRATVYFERGGRHGG